MADVTDDLDRAQVIVVTALVIAVLFVGLALVLNSSINAENTATQDTESAHQNVQEFQQEIDHHLAATVDQINADARNKDPSELEQDLEDSIEEQRLARTTSAARHGESVTFQEFNVREGTRLRQTETRDFRSPDNDADWDVITGVPQSGQFKMNIEGDSVFETTLDTTMALLAHSAFGIEFQENGNEDEAWRIYIFSGALTESVYAIVEEPDQEFQAETLIDRTNPNHITAGWLNQSCSMSGETISIRLGESTFGGTHCEEFSFYNEELADTDSHTVRFINARTHEELLDTDGAVRARGTYDILIEDTDDVEVAPNFDDSDDPEGPFQQSAVYGFDYELEYRTSTTTYTIDSTHLSPQKRDSGGLLWESPKIERFDVTHTEDGATNEYEVDWEVSDENGELARTEIQLVDRTVEEITEETAESNEELLNEFLYTEDVQGDIEELLEDDLGKVIDDGLGDLIDDSTGVLGSILDGLLGGIIGETLGIDDILDNLDDWVAEYYDSVGDAIINLDQPFNTNEVVDETENTISGPQAEGTDDLSHTDLVGQKYQVQLTVVNEAGRSETVIKECDPSRCEVVG